MTDAIEAARELYARITLAIAVPLILAALVTAATWPVWLPILLVKG